MERRVGLPLLAAREIRYRATSVASAGLSGDASRVVLRPLVDVAQDARADSGARAALAAERDESHVRDATAYLSGPAVARSVAIELELVLVSSAGRSGRRLRLALPGAARGVVAALLADFTGVGRVARDVAGRARPRGAVSTITREVVATSRRGPAVVALAARERAW